MSELLGVVLEVVGGLGLMLLSTVIVLALVRAIFFERKADD